MSTQTFLKSKVLTLNFENISKESDICKELKVIQHEISCNLTKPKEEETQITWSLLKSN